MQVTACTSFSIATSRPIAATEIDFFCGSLADVGGRPWHVRFGSFSDFGPRDRDVRYSPESGLNSDIAACPRSVPNRKSARSFDHPRRRWRGALLRSRAVSVA